MLEVRGDFDEALAAAQELARRGTHVLVNSVNPYRRAGQKTAVFEIVEELGAAPDAIRDPVRRRRQHIRLRRPGSASSASRRRSSRSRPSTARQRSPRRSGSAIPSTPTSVRASGATVVTVSDDEIVAAWLELATVEGLFCEPSSAAGLAAIRRGDVPGERLAVTITGHGLKDTESAARFAPALAAGRRRPRRDRRRRPRMSRPRTRDLGQHRRRLRHRRRRLRPLERARGDRRSRASSSRARAPRSSRPTTPTSPSARTRCSPTRRASGSASSTGSRSSAGSARRRPRSRSGSSRRPRTRARRSCWRSGSRSSRTPTTSRRRSLGGLTLAWDGRIARIAERLPLDPIAVIPHARTSTASSRRALPATVPHAEAAASAGRAALLGAGAASGDASLFAAALDDWLHEPYRPSDVLDAIRATPPPGCAGATLSGSGPTVIAWASDRGAVRGRASGPVPGSRRGRARCRAAGRPA